ncbi:hypothetical protein [Microvirga flavescens]|uniref:hypothetical protein n=1 Tax=Microvirga flavescens TaxID=2249811 RepID=UPI001300B6E7|nr:hypothetical protein [Microvirga flavescens]
MSHDGHHHHHSHAHAHPLRAVAMAPTFSLLRFSAWQRLIGAAVALGVLWALVFAVLG